MGGYEEMMTSADKVGGWVKKGQNHDDVILEWSLTNQKIKISYCFKQRSEKLEFLHFTFNTFFLWLFNTQYECNNVQ